MAVELLNRSNTDQLKQYQLLPDNINKESLAKAYAELYEIKKIEINGVNHGR
jgi:hypothetical protein